MTDEPQIHVCNRVRSRVRTMPGLEDTTMQEVVAVWKGEDIGDSFKTIAITREIEDYGFEVRSDAS